MSDFVVRHALVEYTRPDGRPDIAFHGMTVTINDPEQAADRLRTGAVVPFGQELEKAGRMMSLPETASDEQILGWVGDAKPSEVAELIVTRPMLAERVNAAAAIVKQRLESQQELLSGDPAPRPAGAPSPLGADPLAVPVPPAEGTHLQAGADNQVTTVTLNPEPVAAPLDGLSESRPADDVVMGTTGEISAYLADHPSEAPMILQAENHRVDTARANGKADAQPRAGLVRAVQAATAHSSA